MDEVTRYAHNVCFTDYGERCGRYEILACKRHLDDMERAESDPDFPYVFDYTRAERIFRHFRNIPRLDEGGKCIEFEPWQMFDYGSIFGWVKREDGRRRFHTAFIENPRGHAKTTVAAGIGLYCMVGDALYPPGHPEKAVFEMQPEIDIVAVDRFQGRKARTDMADMASSSPAIKKLLSIKRSYIRHKTRGGEVVVFSKDKNNKDGGRPSLVICEEWHAHTTRTLHEAAVKGMGKKAQSLDLIITTAGEDAENKPCYRDVLQYKRVLEGGAKQDDVFIMIREIDDGDDVHDERVWQKANAFFRGDSEYGRRLYEAVKSEHDDAYAMNDYGKIREWLIKRMDKWQPDSANKYFTGCMERFRELEVSSEEFERLVGGREGYYGFDLGETRDLTGVGFCAYLPDGRIAVSVHGFIAQNKAGAHEKSDRVPYLAWAEAGYVTLTPGDVMDNRYVEDYIYTREEKNPSLEIDYDGHNASDMAIRMREHYGREEHIVEIPQTCAMLNGATKTFREMVLSGRIVAEYSPLFEWCLSNAEEVRNSNGDIKISKRNKDDTQRIDPVAALMNALTRLLTGGEGEKVNINEKIASRGFVL